MLINEASRGLELLEPQDKESRHSSSSQALIDYFSGFPLPVSWSKCCFDILTEV
jgi:hypothetical protein